MCKKERKQESKQAKEENKGKGKRGEKKGGKGRWVEGEKGKGGERKGGERSCISLSPFTEEHLSYHAGAAIMVQSIPVHY